MKKALFVLGCVLALVTSAQVAQAQSLEDQELKKAEAAKKKAAAALTVKKQAKSDWGFGFLGIFETAASINRDRPSVASLLYVAPQLKYKQIWRLQLNLGFLGYYLKRDTNPWDLMDGSIQLSALQLYKWKKPGISFSGNLRYYLPMSVRSRNNDSHGAFRLNLKATKSVWKLYFAVEVMAYYYLSKMATSDPERWWDESYIESNPQVGFGEKITISYSPHDKVSLSFLWTWFQQNDYSPKDAYQGVGSTLITESPRKAGLWDYSWSCIFDVTWNVWRFLSLSVGYAIDAPALQNGGAKVSYNPFDARYGQVYLDLMMVY
jgi:hypothetical protein